eukprot:1398548-Rhodomonas_salina.1
MTNRTRNPITSISINIWPNSGHWHLQCYYMEPGVFPVQLKYVYVPPYPGNNPSRLLNHFLRSFAASEEIAALKILVS